MQFRSRVIAPPAEVAGLINTFYVIETAEERVAEPVPAYSAQLVIMVRGQTRFTFADGQTAASSTITINAPQMRAAQCVIEGPALQIGASLTHIGWQRLAGLPADAVHDQLIPAEAVLTPDQITMLENAAAACRAGRIAPEELCAPLAAVVAAAPFTPRAEHNAVAEAILHWLASSLDPKVADLHASVGVSPRQLQRICRRYFGVAPAQVLKRFRALRAAMVLAQPGLSQEVHDRLMETFFDQAHLIRDIRRYTGRTPSQLRQESLGRSLLDPAAHGDAGAPLKSAAE